MTLVVADQARWGLLRVTGRDRLRFLQGMLSVDVAAVPSGGVARALVLSAKARVLAIVEVVNEDDAYLLLAEPACADKAWQLLERHAIADDVAFARIERPIHRNWESPESVRTAPPIFTPADGSPESEVEIRRIEGGLPRYGVDVTEEHLAFEVGLDAAVSVAKGCYVGQEVVARASARGHANRRLVGLRFDGDRAVGAGARITAAARDDVGMVSSSVVSPLFGPIALAVVHRSCWDPGCTVRVGEREGIVSALPFATAS